MADFEKYQVSDVGYPDFTLTEYLKKVEAYIRYVREISGSFQYKGKAYKSESDIEDIIGQLKNEAVQGWAGKPTTELPLFGTLMNQAMSPSWMAGRRGEIATEQTEGASKDALDWRKQAMAEQKWATDQQWKQAEWAWRAGTTQRDWATQQNKLAMEQAGYEEAIQQRDQYIRGMGALSRVQSRLGDQGQPSVDKARIWENARREILAGLDEPIDWIQKWQVQKKKNPYIEEDKDMTPAERRLKWEEKFESAKNMKKIAKEMEDEAKSDPDRSLSFGEKQYIDLAKFTLDNARSNLMDAEYESVTGKSRWAEPRGNKFHGYEVGKPSKDRPPVPTTPETPDWLSNLYPSMGERIPESDKIGSQFAPMALSGQWMDKMKPSELQGYMGYTKYAGESPEDLMWQTQSMLPSPKRGTSYAPFMKK